MRTPEAIGRLEAAPARERIGTTHRPRAVLLLACCAHFGSTRPVYPGARALVQIPAGLLAERWGERRLLALGTAVTGAGFIATGWTGGFASLLLVLLVAGLGSGVQHPLSSTLVSTAYETGRRRAALGMYNFSDEHTSELQSRGHLVCRLLLEKKKKDL